MKKPTALEKIFHGKELIIFDIDGTLVDVLQTHIEIIREAVKAVTGHTIHRDTHISDYFGIPEFESITLILKNRHLPHDAKTVRAIQKKRNALFFKMGKSQIAKNILPGVPALLSALQKQNKVICTITGNTKMVGSTIMQASGLKKYFDYHIFSDDLLKGKKVHERYEMIILAKEKFEQLAKKKIQKRQMIAAGDTPHDVEAAHAVGIESIAVSTGSATLASLRASKPTFLLRNFKPGTRLL